MRQITYIEHIAYTECSVYNEHIKREKVSTRMDGFWIIVMVIFLMWCITTDIIYIIIRFIKLIICKDVEACKNRKCFVKDTCTKYSKFLTQEEYNYLLKLLDDAF